MAAPLLHLLAFRRGAQIEIDTLLLGEPSGFFEALKLGPGADPVLPASFQSCVSELS